MIRVWFSCFTTYQLFNSVYYSMRVNWGNNCKKTLIWINDTKSVIQIDLFRDFFDEIIVLDSLPKVGFIRRQIDKCKNGGRLFAWSIMGKELKKHFEKNILICFSDQHYVTNKLIAQFDDIENSTVVLVEEGVSTYILDEKHKDRFTTSVSNLLWGLHDQKYIGENPRIDIMIVKKPNEMPKEKLLDREVVKQNNIFCDQKWLLELSNKYYQTNIIKSNKPIILWIGQPLGGDYLDESEEMRILDQIFAVISKKYDVLIKKHPSEQEGRYKRFSEMYGVLEKNFGEYTWFPIKIFAKLIQPEIIVTPMSAAAYNIYQTGYNGKIIYCYKLFGIDLGDKYFKEISSKNNIYNVNAIDEIHRVLNYSIVPTEINSTLDNEDIRFFENIIAGK